MFQVCKSSLIFRAEERGVRPDGNDEKYDGASQCEEKGPASIMEVEQHNIIINSSKLIPGMPGWVRQGTLSDNSPTL